MEIEPVEIDELNLELEFRLSGWASADYMAYGYSNEGSNDYVHIKFTHPPNEEVSPEVYKKYKCVRSIQFDKTNSQLIIDDEVVNLYSEYDVNPYSVFHLGPGVKPTLLDDGKVSLTQSGGLRLLLESRETPRVIFGAGESIKQSSHRA